VPDARTLYRRFFLAYRYWWLSACLFVLTICLTVNFGHGTGRPGRQPVFGRVTSGGKPLAGGSISFYPAEGQTGPAANTRIANGRYEFSRDDGPFAGPHHIVVLFVRDAQDESRLSAAGTKGKRAAAPVGKAADGGESTPPAADPPPPAAATQSHAWESDVEVPAKGSLRVDLEVPE